MATDPIIVGNVKWPNDFQNPTGIVAGAANPAMDPIALANSEIPADSSKPAYAPTKPDTTVSTDSTQGRTIDTYA